MKIAIMGSINHFGGGPLSILEFYKALKDKHEVTILADFYNEENTYSEFKKLPVRIIKYSCGPIPFIRRFTVVFGWLKLDTSEYDLCIATHSYSHMASLRNSNILCYMLSVRTLFQSPEWSRYPGILKYAEYALNLPFRQLERKAIKKSGCVVGCSKFNSRRIGEIYGVHAEPIPLSVAFDNFFSKPAEDYCLYAGRLSFEKRIDLIINAWKHVKGDLKLYIAGGGKKDYIARIKAMAESDKRIIFTGPLEKDELYDIYAKCLCVIYVPEQEDLGMVGMEAHAACKPVIISDEGGIMELVRDNIDGYIINPTPENIAEKVNYLNENRDTAFKMGKEGRVEVEKYTWKVMCDRMVDYGIKTLGNGGRIR